MAEARITIVQSDEASTARKNLERMKRDVRAHAGSDLIVFPELALHGHAWTTRADPEPLAELQEDLGRELDEIAAEQATSIVYGEARLVNGRIQNLATFTNGRERVSYAKAHVHWSERFAPGAEFPVVSGFQRPLGMLICYDAAFAEVPRLLALAGAEMIVNLSAIPAEFPLRHVHRRLVACSVQNQVFTIFANRSGQGFLGGSAVVDPQGEMVALAGKTGALTVDIDLDDVRRWREREPIFPHRRPDVYREIAR